jgi:DNA polymerase-3 subunit gamma/tau
MAYQSLYRKYRPQTFSDVVGQGPVVRTLQNALLSGRIAHGYLFTGTRGTAKTTIARLLAKALNCESQDRPVAEPCNACEACAAITSGACIDVIELDAASHRGVADIEEVRRAVGFGPMQYRYKVFIIDEAHQLSSDAKDAFLKTLEEPPASVVFILATTEPQAIPITIRSRCQQFDFKRGSLTEITARLEYVLSRENVAHTPEAVTLVARGAEGSYRDALSLLEQVLAYSPERIDTADVEAVLGALDASQRGRLFTTLVERDAAGALALAGEILDAGKEARTLLRALAAHLRDLLLVRIGGPAAAAQLTPDEVATLQPQARLLAPPQLLRALDLVNEAQSEMRWNNQHRLLVELTLLKLMALDTTAPTVEHAPAPIVFATASPKPTPPKPAPPIASAPTAPPPPVPVAAAPTLPDEPEPDRDDETLPTGFFSDDATIDDEDDYEPAPAPLVAAPPVAEPLLLTDEDDDAPRADDAEEPEHNDGMSLFEEVAVAPEPAVGAPEPEPVATDPRITLETVQRAWPRFLHDAEQISMQAAVMMAAAIPTAVQGTTIVLTFSVRANYELMSLPKKQEFVRRLLARSLGLDSDTVPVRFALDPHAGAAPQRSIAREKVRLDPGQRLDAHLRGTASAEPDPQTPSAAPPFTPTPAPRAAEPRPPRPTPAPDRPDAAAAARARNTTALAEPLVQEALSVFGGDVVDD